MKSIAYLKKSLFGLFSRKNQKPLLLVICGPTATGKTALSIAISKMLAKENRSTEIISTDSRQIYRGLDIGSAKITKEEMEGIPHHMIDVADPSEIFTVAEYQNQAQKIIQHLHENNKIPILVGGTGMYINAVIDNIHFPKVPPNKKLRDELENLSLKQLQARLEMVDPHRHQTIDIQNPARLRRAIEIAETLGSVPPSQQTQSPYRIIMIGLDIPDDILRGKIHERNVLRLEHGLLEEVKNLHDHGLSWSRMFELGLEYRYVSQFLCGEIQSKDALLETLDTKIWQFAKRQRTWFKRDKRIQWFDPIHREEILNYVKEKLSL